MKRNTPSLWNLIGRAATADTAPLGLRALEGKWRRAVRVSLLTVGIAAITLTLTACIAPIDYEDEADDAIASHGFALGTGENEKNNGGVDTSKSKSPERESGGSSTGSTVQSGDVEEPDPVPWKGSGSKKGSGQDNGD
ncbi:MAG: hypothetical protein VB934_06485 [Polyangiaceae bacterium]